MKRARSALAGGAVALVTTCVIAAGGSATAQDPDPRAERAEQLGHQPPVDRAAAPSIAAGEARDIARRRAGEVPLPDGGNLNGIRWESAGGVLSAAEIDTVIQYNAFCQWLRAVADGREAAIASDILGKALRWPGLRDSAAGWLDQVVAEARAGGGGAYDATLAECRASHEREAGYAARRGAVPSS